MASLLAINSQIRHEVPSRLKDLWGNGAGALKTIKKTAAVSLPRYRDKIHTRYREKVHKIYKAA